jgi:hypothetical protein
MPKFMVLYHANVPASEMMAQSTPEQMKAGMEAWLTWADDNRPAIVELGMPLQPARRVEAGAVNQAGGTVSGYSVLEAGSVDEAARILAAHPHLRTPGGAWIEVLEFLAVPGM